MHAIYIVERLAVMNTLKTNIYSGRLVHLLVCDFDIYNIAITQA